MLLNEMENEFGDDVVRVLVSKLEFYIWEVNNYITSFVQLSNLHQLSARHLLIVHVIK